MSTEHPSLDDPDGISKGPHAWIQWKGTNVCMDVRCACGYHGHVDDWGAYYVICPGCDRTYEVSGFVRLYPVSREIAFTGSDPKDIGGD